MAILAMSIRGSLVCFLLLVARKFKHVKREYNKAAHELVQYARMKEESHCWKGVCPPMVIHVIQEDGV